MNLAAPWEEYSRFFNVTVLTSLEYCADALPKEPPVSADELSQIQTLLSDLMAEIESSKIDVHLKKWLLTLTSEARYSIDRYKIEGARTFRRALRDCYGDMILFQQTFPTFAVSAQKGTPLGDRLMSFLNCLNASRQK